jgi:tetratricopeptide (TPR) repeat protein
MVAPNRSWVQLASITHLKRNIQWHLNLAYTFREIGTPTHIEQALLECRRAKRKSKDNKSVLAVECATLYQLQRYQQSIRLGRRALQLTSAFQVSEKIWLLDMIVNAHLYLGDVESAVTTALEMHTLAPWSDDAAYNVIYALHNTHRSQQSVNFLKSLFESQGPQIIGDIMLSHLYGVEFMFVACARTNELDFARNVFRIVIDDALVAGDKYRAARARSALAQLYFRHYRDDDKAIELWESVVREYPRTHAAFKAALSLAPYYYTKASDAEAIGVDPTSWIWKLESLDGQLEKPGLKELNYPTPHDVSALIAKWYASHGNMEQARSKVRAMVLQGIKGLTDRDHSNDRAACFHLGRALNCIGDRENAAIAYAFTKPLQKTKKLQELEQSLEDVRISQVEAASVDHRTSNGPASGSTTEVLRTIESMGSCDGRCDNLTEASFRSFSTCEICIDIDFCDVCLGRVKSGTLDFRICDPNHPFLETYPPKGLVIKTAEGYMVRKGGTMMTADEWLGAIRVEWFSDEDELAPGLD